MTKQMCYRQYVFSWLPTPHKGPAIHNQGAPGFYPGVKFIYVRMKIQFFFRMKVFFVLPIRPLVYYMTERELNYGLAGTCQHPCLPI